MYSVRGKANAEVVKVSCQVLKIWHLNVKPLPWWWRWQGCNGAPFWPSACSCLCRWTDRFIQEKTRCCFLQRLMLPTWSVWPTLHFH